MTNARQNRTSSGGTVRSLLLMGAVLFLVVVGAKASRKLIGGVPPSQLLVHLTPWAFLWLLALLVFVPGFVLAERADSAGRRPVRWWCWFVRAGGSMGVRPADWLAYRRGSLPRLAGAAEVRPSDVLLRMGLAAFIYAGHRNAGGGGGSRP
jgi:hypothetical protein